MGDTAWKAWEVAEKNCFEHLKTNLPPRGYTPKLPLTISSFEHGAMWYFVMNGETASPIQINEAAKPTRFLRMGADFGGIFVERRDGQRMAGKIWNALPTNVGTIDYVTRFTYVGVPSLVPDTIFIGNDQAKGGEIEIWKLVFPMEVVFQLVPD